MNKKIIIVIAIAVVVVVAVGWFVWHVESYMAAEQAWRSQATQMINQDSQNIQAMIQYLQAHPIKQ